MSLKLATSGFVGLSLILFGCVVEAATPPGAAPAKSTPAASDAASQKAAPQKDATPETQLKSAPAAKSQTTEKTDSGNLAEVEQQIVDKTNAQRAKYGLPPLALDKGLEKTARTHAAWMTNNHTLQHTNQNVGENIAMGQRNSNEAVTDWMNSPGHRANILSGSYKRIGVAAYQATDGTTYWCQQFLP